MRKFYQTEWQGIVFNNFTSTNSKNLAGPDFYNLFYHEIFLKYPNYESLESHWQRNKDELVDWIAGQLPDCARVLSVGCGLGYMEYQLWQLLEKRIELHVQDYASQALKWLRQVLPPDRIHDIGDTEIGDFDLIYMSAVDYAMTDDDLIALIESLRGRLRGNGALLMISASFLDESVWQRFISNAKEIVNWLLEKAGIHHRGQFWGWMRTRQDYQSIMQKANVITVCDGFIKTSHQKTYWIKGTF